MKRRLDFGHKTDDLATKTDVYDEDCMRSDLNYIKEAIKENRDQSKIFKKIEICENEIFKLFSNLKTDSNVESESKETGRGHNQESEKPAVVEEGPSKSFEEENSVDDDEIEYEEIYQI